MDDLSDAVDLLYEEGMPGGDSTGWKHLDYHYTVRRGQITVLTGSPGSGKSVWLDALLMNLARNRDWKLGICSPEFQPLARHEAHLIALYVGKPFGEGPTERLTVEERDFAKKWLATRFWFVMPEEITLDAILDRAKVMVKRYGIGGFVIDPWNDLDDTRPSNMTETEFIHGALRKMRAFCRNHNVHIWVVAHPTKLRKGVDGKYPPATLYDINGSAGWFNKTDNGLSLWRDYADPSAPVTLYVQKIKFHEVGGLGSANFYHDRLTGRYWEAPGNE
jgi:twinkle protein